MSKEFRLKQAHFSLDGNFAAVTCHFNGEDWAWHLQNEAKDIREDINGSDVWNFYNDLISYSCIALYSELNSDLDESMFQQIQSFKIKDYKPIGKYIPIKDQMIFDFNPPIVFSKVMAPIK